MKSDEDVMCDNWECEFHQNPWLKQEIYFNASKQGCVPNPHSLPNTKN